MKGRYSESCRITLHEENFFMREEMTMAYTFSRLIFYAEFKNDNLFDVRSKSRERLIAYKIHTFLKWPNVMFIVVVGGSDRKCFELRPSFQLRVACC